MEAIIGLLLTIALIFIAITVLLSFVPLGLWISALAAGVKIGIFNLVGMRLREYLLPNRKPSDKGCKAV